MNNPDHMMAALAARQEEHTRWRRDLHAHPELAFEEQRTSDFVAEKLAGWGVKVTRGVGGTGVVGTLTAGRSNRAIGLRADMDALAMQEANAFAHRSREPGRMHGCGHDGHTVMLLAAAHCLARHQPFEGTVHLIFQPAEEANETGSGAQAMIDDGLFERFPMDSLFGLHNWPLLPAGHFDVRSGPVMAAMALIEITVSGRGTHGALPHTGVDTVYATSQLISAWHGLISRAVDPLDSAVVSLTSVQAGEGSWNVLPDSVRVRGTVRYFNADTGRLLEQRFRAIARDMGAALGVTVNVNWQQRVPPLANDAELAGMAHDVALEVAGPGAVEPLRTTPHQTGSEDFACYLRHIPGAYLWLGGGGDSGQSPYTCMLHDARYDFNDAIIPVGAAFWIRLVQRLLPLDPTDR